jgi:hypothetical protein
MNAWPCGTVWRTKDSLSEGRILDFSGKRMTFSGIRLPEIKQDLVSKDDCKLQTSSYAWRK